ncbi:MAG: hypothetical protein M3395_04850 [Chloroflexota bacterium]|nr:hypothetical protein [Chloroflexota bacterium]
MRRSRGILLLGLVAVALVGGCAATAPPGPSQAASAPVASAPVASAPAASATPSASVVPASDPAGTPPSPSVDPALPTASNIPAAPSSAPTLAPGGRLAIRYSGTAGTQFEGVVTGLFDDGAVVPVPASGVVQARPFTRTMGEAMVSLRVTGTIVSGDGTYRVEILGGHLEEGIFIEDQVLAVSEAMGRGGEVRVDYGDIDL